MKNTIVKNIADKVVNKYGKDILEKADKMINAKLGYKGGKEILKKAKESVLNKLGEKSCSDVVENYGTQILDKVEQEILEKLSLIRTESGIFSFNKSIWKYKAVNMYGENIKIQQYKGKVLLFVNMGRKSKRVE